MDNNRWLGLRCTCTGRSWS